MPSGQESAADVASQILVLARVEGDAEALCHVLNGAGFDAQACSDIAGLAAGIAHGAGAVILTQEAFAAEEGEETQVLAGALSRQPEWSDLPVILLAGAGAGEERSWTIARRLGRVGNISILERPLRRTTLLNAMAVALRARARQYQLRSVLLELASHRGRLEELVERRTAELAVTTAGLHAAERLAALGTLAAGLGHDIANLTLPIRARLEAIAVSKDQEETQADIAAIYQALDHLTSLSAGMRLMALDPQRTRASTPTEDLAAWGDQTMSVLRAGLPRHVRLECELPPGVGVPISRHRLTQAVFNLVQNAGEAMADQQAGIVRVTAGTTIGPGGTTLVVMRVTDDGPGMSPDVRACCFEPYFSTKGRALSTGMGLGMVRGIVESAGGTVALDSTLGQGTTFTLTIPAIEPQDKAGEPALPRRTAAVTVNRERTATLACMFLEQLNINPVRHPSGLAPDAALWILDDAEPSLIAEYLEKDPLRRAVVLGGPCSDEGAPDCSSRRGEGRVTTIAASPAASELRDALAAAGRVARPRRQGW